MLLNGEHNFAHNPPAAAAANAAPGPSADCDAAPFPASSLDSNPNSQIQNPKSSARRAVPTTFNPIINDEANILAAIARGDRTLPDLAEAYGTTVSNFAVWLQREDIQKKLADLTSAGATLTRIAAVNHLPKAVSAMSFQIDGYIADRCRNLIKPGLDADRVAAIRDANVRKASHLLLRLARFDPNQPLYRKREPVNSTVGKLPQGGAVEPGFAGETEGALVFSTALSTAPLLSSTSDIPHPTPDIDVVASGSSTAFSTGFSPTLLPVFTSHIPLPTSEITPAASASELLPRQGEVSPKATEGAPAFSTAFSTGFSTTLLPAFTSDFPLPTSHIPLPASHKRGRSPPTAAIAGT